MSVGNIHLSEGNFYLGAPVDVPTGVVVVGGKGADPDRPTIVQYQEGAEPDFPLFRGSNPSAPDMECTTCSQVLATGLGHDQLTDLFLQCHCGDGLDLFASS